MASPSPLRRDSHCRLYSPFTVGVGNSKSTRRPPVVFVLFFRVAPLVSDAIGDGRIVKLESFGPPCRFPALGPGERSSEANGVGRSSDRKITSKLYLLGASDVAP